MVNNKGLVNDRNKSYVVTEVPDSSNENMELFVVTATLTSAAAATPVNALPAARVGAGRKVYIDDFTAKVNGSTDWATTATLTIEGTDGTDFATIAVAALTGNACVGKNSANVTLTDLISLMTGGVAGYGLQVKGNANGTGSDLVFVIRGRIVG